jgi:hypothetical protein
MRAVRDLRVAGTLLCAIVLGAVALAGATTKKDGGIVDHETVKFTAKCPKGERIDVGGFKTTINEPSGILIEDLFFKGARKWRATFDGLGNAAPATAIAYCDDTPRLTKRTGSDAAPAAPRERARGVGSGFPLAASAKCPKGTTVQLGGFSVRDEISLPEPRRGGPNSGFRPSAMKAVSARKWRVEGIAVDPGVELTAIAGCADLPAPTAVDRTEDVAPGGSTSAKAKCPDGERVVMGGFEQTPFDGGGPYIRALKRSGSSAWKAKTWEFDDPASLTAIAYCA